MQYVKLWELIEANSPFTFNDLPDKFTWRWTANGCYSAASAYQAQFIGKIQSQVCSEIWHTKAIPKCRLYTWLMIHNRCLTADNLAKRGWPHDPICSLCRCQLETASHLAAFCSFSQLVWTKVLATLSMPVTLNPNPAMLDVTMWWKEIPKLVPKLIVSKWRSVALCTWWMLWKERNNRIFNNKSRLPEVLAEKIIEEITAWKKAGVLRDIWEPGE